MASTDTSPESDEGKSQDSKSLSQWLGEPQTMIGLAAVLLSVCGLFVSMHEASLMRQAQRGSVWPAVSFGVSLSSESDTVEISVRNKGIGPARIRAARIEHEGERQEGWSDLLESIGQRRTSLSSNLINDGVLSPGEERRSATVVSDSSQRTGGYPLLAQGILDGSIDLVLCYCSVYDECWLTTMQRRLRGMQDFTDQRSSSSGGSAQEEVYEKVESCQGVESSGI